MTKYESAMVLLQIISVLVAIGGVAVLWWQIKETGKRVTDASIRSLWFQLRSDRRQMEADVTKIDIEQGEFKRRREQLKEGIRQASRLSEALETSYPDAFTRVFKEEADKERDSLQVV
jgi:hypothetical protein